MTIAPLVGVMGEGFGELKGSGGLGIKERR